MNTSAAAEFQATGFPWLATWELVEPTHASVYVETFEGDFTFDVEVFTAPYEDENEKVDEVVCGLLEGDYGLVLGDALDTKPGVRITGACSNAGWCDALRWEGWEPLSVSV